MNGQEFIINIYEPFMFIHDYLCSAAGRKEETNYRNTHNLSRNGHNIMFICGAITRITRICFKEMFGQKRITKNEKELYPIITKKIYF